MATSQPSMQQIDKAEIVAMSDEVVQMLRLVEEDFRKLDASPAERVGRLGRTVHRQERGLIARLVKAGNPAAAGAPAIDEEVGFVPMHLERIAEHIEALATATDGMVRDGTLFTNRATREVSGMFETVVELLEGLRDALTTGNTTLIRYVLEAGRSCETRANEYALVHEQRLIEGVSQPRASSVYLAMLDGVKGIEWHARQIAEKLRRAPIRPEGAGRDAEADLRRHVGA